MITTLYLIYFVYWFIVFLYAMKVYIPMFELHKWGFIHALKVILMIFGLMFISAIPIIGAVSILAEHEDQKRKKRRGF